MITKNGSELLKGALSAYLDSTNYYGAIDGVFTDHNGTNYTRVYAPYSATTSETYGRRNAYMMVLFGACGYGEYVLESKNEVVSLNPGQGVFVCTYDGSHGEISQNTYQIPGNDTLLTVSVTTQNNLIHTLTYTNATSTVARANRIGIYFPFGKRIGSLIGNTSAILTHIFAIDDIVLEPNETKSITIALEL